MLRAHKIVLAICSSYFQEMFIQNQHQHPIIIMPHNMEAKLVCNLLEFMYKGVVNVKQSELQNFMKIAETLHIKGLTTKEPAYEVMKEKTIKRSHEESSDLPEDGEPDQKSKEIKLDVECEVTDLTQEDEQLVDDDNFDISTVSEVTIEPRKHESRSRDSFDHPLGGLKISSTQSLTSYEPIESLKATNSAVPELPNEVPSSGSNITLLSSTSLLHGSCVFNRNNTVATQAGLKTYWLCKSYRVSMCKVRYLNFRIF